MKIIHKGLILVGVPLVFGITFVSVLFCGLAESNRIFQHELLLKDAMITDNVTTRCSFAARICAMSYLFTHNKSFKQSLSSNLKDAEVSYGQLRQLLKNESSIQMPPQISRKEMITGNAAYLMEMHAFMQKLQGLTDRETLAAKKSMNWLQSVLIAGMLGSTVITVALAVFFCLNITSRLLIIMNNTMSLASGRPLSPPLKGSDEIAELDQFIFRSAGEIRQLEQFKKEMIGVVSHELKSPLSSVEMFLCSLKNGVFGDLNLKAQDRVERTHENVIRLMELVKELLYLDRLELGMRPENVTAEEIVRMACGTVEELSEQLGIKIVVKEIDGNLFADRNRLVQVVVNLLSNAMKFSPTAAEVTIETRERDGWFECRVSDNGPGIPEEFRKQIFEPFKQINYENDGIKKGTGLGLTISRSIVQEHCGEIGVDSLEGTGSTFWFRIPASAEFQAACRQNDRPNASAFHELEAPLASNLAMRAQKKTMRAGRFSVLKQGLIIISVPLVFQFGFVSVIGGLLYQVQQHVRREEHSKEILDTLNRMAQEIVVASNYGAMYVFSHDPRYLSSWQNGKHKALELVEHLRQISVADSAQQQNIKDTGRAFQVVSVVLEQLISKNQKLGLFNLADLQSSGAGGFSNFKSMFNKSGTTLLVKPILRGLKVQSMIMAKEKEIGENLSAQRSAMIKNAQLALCAGIVINIILSICLAVYLIRNLTSRLLHVNQNMERLVKREALEPPLKGSDEIAYLDQILFETGNHLVELEAFKRELISIVSHELRTPLLSVSFALELLGSGSLGNLSPKGMSRLKIAQEEAQRLIRLINDLLDIEKMEAGKFVLDKAEIRIADLIQSSIEAVAAQADMKAIKLLSWPSDLVVLADRDRLCQVLINLLSNAIKFSPEGAAVKIQVYSDDSTLEFRVVDTGRGIPEELRQSIFNRFVQVDKTDALERGGTGLGLAIAKAIVEQHGGSIGVQSVLGRGSAFWVKLPNTCAPIPVQLPAITETFSVTLGSHSHRHISTPIFAMSHETSFAIPFDRSW